MAILEGAGFAKPVDKSFFTGSILFTKLSNNSKIPTKAHETDAGFDLYCNEEVQIVSGERKLVGTGVAVAIPKNAVGLVCPRSGLAYKFGITITNAPGIIDSGYRGELKVILHNTGSDNFVCEAGSRIAQLVVVPYLSHSIEVSDLSESDRGTNGFGSSGA